MHLKRRRTSHHFTSILSLIFSNLNQSRQHENTLQETAAPSTREGKHATQPKEVGEAAPANYIVQINFMSCQKKKRTAAPPQRKPRKAAPRKRREKRGQHHALEEEEDNTSRRRERGAAALPRRRKQHRPKQHRQRAERGESNTTRGASSTTPKEDGTATPTKAAPPQKRGREKAVPLQRASWQTTPHKRTRGKAASPRRVRYRKCQRQRQVPKTQSITHITPITEENSTPRTNDSRGSGFGLPDVLGLPKKMVNPRTRQKPIHETAPTKEEEEGNTTHNEERGWQAAPLQRKRRPRSTTQTGRGKNNTAF